MVRLLNSIKIAFQYVGNLFFWNKEGWYIGNEGTEPPVQSQVFRIKTGKKPYHERTCVMCKRKFWTYKKTDVCFRIECYFKYKLQVS